MAKTVEQLRNKQRQIADAYRAVFRGPNGQAVLADLEERFLNRAAHKLDKEGRTDIYATMANEGARQCVLFIKNRLQGENNERVDD